MHVQKSPFINPQPTTVPKGMASGHPGLLIKQKPLSSFCENEFHRIYWEGLLFVAGIPSGEESAQAFLNELKDKGIERGCSVLRGIFFALIEDKLRGTMHAFVDNSGLFQAFHGHNTVSNSFLALIDHLQLSAEDLDPLAVTEFLNLGNVHGYRTFYPSIKKITENQILVLSRDDGRIEIVKKSFHKSAPPSQNDARSFFDAFAQLATSLQNRRVSIDLTGGVDSRLIAVMLDHFQLEFETAVSGANLSSKEFAISSQVAGLLNHPWFSSIHEISSLESDISEMFQATEGLEDILYYHRLHQFQARRRARDIDTVISGTGGEFYKDTWWLQDFPFYSKTSTNIRRFVDLRVWPAHKLEFLLSDEHAEISRNLREDMVDKLSGFARENNTRTFDNISLNYLMREKAGRMLTSNSRRLLCFAPFLDRNLVHYGLDLPVANRVFNSFHRKQLTALHPKIAKIQTSEGGVSASNRGASLLADVPRYFGNRAKRLLHKYGLVTTRHYSSLNHPDLYGIARNLTSTLTAITALQDVGIIRAGIGPRDIQDYHLGKVLALGLLISNRGVS